MGRGRRFVNYPIRKLPVKDKSMSHISQEAAHGIHFAFASFKAALKANNERIAKVSDFWRNKNYLHPRSSPIWLLEPVTGMTSLITTWPNMAFSRKHSLKRNPPGTLAREKPRN
ncbi:hypothetical protein CEXT_411981 [Caerostris extrusa]|uniref:Uncharacterized protein n=1 Tax=Caerostris extrusa TaxID=172846 RepID=A0AAV4UI96_CAEEX|nr:hypothetical protein CEXT_411981 [Caerostris extrusa]